MYKDTPRSLNIIQVKKSHSSCYIIKRKVNILIISSLSRPEKQPIPTHTLYTSQAKIK